jgi:hypothetical protein
MHFLQLPLLCHLKPCKSSPSRDAPSPCPVTVNPSCLADLALADSGSMAFEENGERIEDLKMIAQKVRNRGGGKGAGPGCVCEVRACRGLGAH